MVIFFMIPKELLDRQRKALERINRAEIKHQTAQTELSDAKTEYAKVLKEIDELINEEPPQQPADFSGDGN